LYGRFPSQLSKLACLTAKPTFTDVAGALVSRKLVFRFALASAFKAGAKGYE
jgi:hypothetical protein